MNKQERLFLVIKAIESSEIDVHELVDMLELDVRELCGLIPNYLLQMEHKFILQSELDEVEDDIEEIEIPPWDYNEDAEFDGEDAP